jgi:hypothetical protein
MKKFIQISVIVLFVLAVAGTIFMVRSTGTEMAGGVVCPSVGWNTGPSVGWNTGPSVGWNTKVTGCSAPVAGDPIFYKIVPQLPMPCVGWNS